MCVCVCVRACVRVCVCVCVCIPATKEAGKVSSGFYAGKSRIQMVGNYPNKLKILKFARKLDKDLLSR